jgi:ferredoxin
VSAVIFASALRKLIGGRIKSGVQVIAPVAVGDRLLYQRLNSAQQAVFDSRSRPANSIKDFVFPRHEALFAYRMEGRRVELNDLAADDREQIILAAKPCDANALTVLDHVFHWDYKDECWDRGRKRTTIVALACEGHDEACFCTSVGSGPAEESGSDAMLFDLGDGTFQVKILTDKGRELFAGNMQTSDRKPAVMAGPEKKFDAERIAAYLTGNFESAVWADETLACLGCGVCAYTCPTCHCFDIVDEGNAAKGVRVRNWDSCQFPTFTEHASGHNPRSVQPQRQRQRIYHKFVTYPEKFGATLCTGCGNCARNCPVGLGVLRVVEAIDRQAIAADERERIQA